MSRTVVDRSDILFSGCQSVRPSVGMSHFEGCHKHTMNTVTHRRVCHSTVARASAISWHDVVVHAAIHFTLTFNLHLPKATKHFTFKHCHWGQSPIVLLFLQSSLSASCLKFSFSLRFVCERGTSRAYRTLFSGHFLRMFLLVCNGGDTIFWAAP